MRRQLPKSLNESRARTAVERVEMEKSTGRLDEMIGAVPDRLRWRVGLGGNVLDVHKSNARADQDADLLGNGDGNDEDQVGLGD